MNKDKIKQIELKVIDRNKFNGDVSVREKYQKPSFSGCIQNLKSIKVEYSPDFNGPFESAFESVLEHEVVHKQDGTERGCPKTVNNDLEKILTPISITLKKKGLPNTPIGNQGHTLYTFFANLFEDLVVNTIVSDNCNSNGIFSVYEDALEFSGCNNLFEAFLKLQAMAYPHIDGVSKLIPYFKQNEKTNKAVKNFLSRTELLKIPKKERVDFLSNPENWEKLSTIFTEELSELLEKKDIQSSYFPVFGVTNSFGYLDEEETQMDIAMKSYGKKGSRFEPPVFMEDNTALLSVYRKLARNLEIKVNSNSAETQYPITHVSRRKFNFEKDNLERMRFGVNPKGKIEMQTGKYPIIIKSRYNITQGNFPEVRVGFIDCSDSTRDSVDGNNGKIMNPWSAEDMQWTDNSIYHNELLAFFGLMELFRRKGTLRSSNVCLGSFSSSTRIAKGLKEAELLALKPEFNGTYLSDKAVNTLFSGNGSLVYTLSDGEIQNWSSIKNKFMESAKKHYYFHLQIGSESKMHNDLLNTGLASINVDPRNAAKTIIDLTQTNIYGIK